MKRVQTHVKYGLITALACVVLGLVLYITNLSFEWWASWLSYVILLGGLILNANAFSKANDANVTFGNVFGSCFKAAAITSVIMAIWMVTFMQIFPEMTERGMEYARANMEKKGMSEDQIEMGMEMSKKFMNPAFMAGIGLVAYLFMGTVFSLIAAAVAKKNPMPEHMPGQ